MKEMEEICEYYLRWILLVLKSEPVVPTLSKVSSILHIQVILPFYLDVHFLRCCSHPSWGLLYFLHSHFLLQPQTEVPVSSGTPNKASGHTSSQLLSQILADTLIFFLPFICQKTTGLCTSC